MTELPKHSLQRTEDIYVLEQESKQKVKRKKPGKTNVTK